MANWQQNDRNRLRQSKSSNSQNYSHILGGGTEKVTNDILIDRVISNYWDTLPGRDYPVRGYGSKCAQKSYEWSEIKSSLLMQELILNEGFHKELSDFMRNMVINMMRNIYGTNTGTPLQANLLVQMLTDYNKDLAKNQQKSSGRAYPVAQSLNHHTQFVQIKTQIKIARLMGDQYEYNKAIGRLYDSNQFNRAYPLYNIMKWLWANTTNYKYGLQAESVNVQPPAIEGTIVRGLIMAVQQNIPTLNGIRGDRVRGPFVNNPQGGTSKISDTEHPDFGNPNDPMKTNQIGITNVEVDYLDRSKSLPVEGASSAPWDHPGETTCRLPRLGGIGRRLGGYRDNNSVWGSIQCGISGSTNFALFSYLTSISRTGVPQGRAPMQEVQNLILCSCLGLVGDGGHNIREVLFGLTQAIIVLKNMIDMVKEEVCTIAGSSQSDFRRCIDRAFPGTDPAIPRNIGPRGGILRLIKYSIDNDNNNDFFHRDSQVNLSENAYMKRFIQALANWEDFVAAFYEFTSDINITGVNENDLKDFFSADDTISKLSKGRTSLIDRDSTLRNSAPFYRGRPLTFPEIRYDVMWSIFRGKGSFENVWDNYDSGTRGREMFINKSIYFLSLENDRYTLNIRDNFKKIVDTKLDLLITNASTYPNITSANVTSLKYNIHKQLKIAMRKGDNGNKCKLQLGPNQPRSNTWLDEDMRDYARTIPYAFNSVPRGTRRRRQRRKNKTGKIRG